MVLTREVETSILEEGAPEANEEARLDDDNEPRCRAEPLRGMPLWTDPWPEVELLLPARADDGDENILERALRAFTFIEERKPSLLGPAPSPYPA